MRYYELNKEEEELLKEVESGSWRSGKDAVKLKKAVILAAKNTLNKTKNVNLRLSERVLTKLKAKAAKEGMPYQTLASSILHKHVNND